MFSYCGVGRRLDFGNLERKQLQAMVITSRDWTGGMARVQRWGGMMRDGSVEMGQRDTRVYRRRSVGGRQRGRNLIAKIRQMIFFLNSLSLRARPNGPQVSGNRNIFVVCELLFSPSPRLATRSGENTIQQLYVFIYVGRKTGTTQIYIIFMETFIKTA